MRELACKAALRPRNVTITLAPKTLRIFINFTFDASDMGQLGTLLQNELH